MIDFYGSLYIRADNFKNFHPFSPLPAPVDLHFRPKMAWTCQKSIIFTENGGSRSIIWIRNDLKWCMYIIVRYTWPVQGNHYKILKLKQNNIQKKVFNIGNNRIVEITKLKRVPKRGNITSKKIYMSRKPEKQSLRKTKTKNQKRLVRLNYIPIERF